MNKAIKVIELNSSQKDFLNGLYDESIHEGSHSLCDELDEITERYELISALAVGGMKEILVCEDKSTGRHVAKAVLKEKKNESAIEDFLREARVTASLQHPNIIPIYDIGKDEDGLPFFTMKLIDGQNLAEYILEKKRDLNELLDIFLKVCDAIAYAHANAVIHLDLKPENIQVSQYGEALVCDWGLARILGSKIKNEKFESYMLNEGLGDNKTLDGFIKGSPGYMAPEQVNFELGKKDEVTDIYALGGLLYYILTERNTVQDGDLETKLKDILSGNFPLPSDLKNIPYSLEVICLKALKSKKEERYQSVGEMIKDLRSYLNGFAPTSENPSFYKQGALFYKRNKKSCITAIVFLFLLFSSGLFYTLQLQKANKEKSILYNELEDKIISVANAAYKDSDFEQAHNLLQSIYTEDVIETKANIEFIFQNFEEVEKILINRKDSNLYKLNSFFKNAVQDGRIPSTKLLEAMNLNYFDKILKVSFFKYHLSHYSDQQEKLLLIPKLMQGENGITDLHCTYKHRDDGIAVDISNNPRMRKFQWLKYFGNVTEMDISNTNLSMYKGLANLPLKKLKSVNVPISSLHWLPTETIEEIDIRGTLIQSLEAIHKFISLKTLTVSPDFPKEELEKVPKQVMLIIKE